jgi:hypothetical protein
MWGEAWPAHHRIRRGRRGVLGTDVLMTKIRLACMECDRDDFDGVLLEILPKPYN